MFVHLGETHLLMLTTGHIYQWISSSSPAAQWNTNSCGRTHKVPRFNFW